MGMDGLGIDCGCCGGGGGGSVSCQPCNLPAANLIMTVAFVGFSPSFGNTYTLTYSATGGGGGTPIWSVGCSPSAVFAGHYGPGVAPNGKFQVTCNGVQPATQILGIPLTSGCAVVPGGSGCLTLAVVSTGCSSAPGCPDSIMTPFPCVSSSYTCSPFLLTVVFTIPGSPNGYVSLSPA